MAEPFKPLVVISYAHADEPEHPAEGEIKWLSFVTGYLRPAIKHGAVDLWIDRLMPGGADWEREIEQKLRACDIFILLVSRHSLSSDYVVGKEVAIIRERQAKGEDVHFFPLVLTPTPKIALDLVRDKNLRPRDGKPLSDYAVNERYRHMADAADEIAEIAGEIAARKSRPTSPPQPKLPPSGHLELQRGQSERRQNKRVSSPATPMRISRKHDRRKHGRSDPAKVLNALAQPLLTVDPQGMVIDVNIAAESFFNMERLALLHSRLTDLLPFGSPVLALVSEALSNHVTVNGYRIDISTRRTGNRGAVDVFIAPLSQPGEAVAVMIQDRAFAEKIGRQLTRRSAARSVAPAEVMLAHGIKAPLSGMPNIDAPFAYGWNASLRVTVVAGAQNLPFYPHFSSEEDHRRALEACRVGGERLLKALRGGRYNARKEYGDALKYYLDDLPKAAGKGNILLANNQASILRDMFLADVDMLPAGFASALKNVIYNQFALNAFYDLVQRHNEAVSAGNWAQPFPLDAAKGFFGAVEDNTPRWFEQNVEQGLRQVEQAEPPAAPPVEREPAPSLVIEPPPLPPGTPDALQSWQRQMATAANALWETFLQGRDMPVAQDEWREAADDLGAHVRPIIDFLRAQDERKG